MWIAFLTVGVGLVLLVIVVAVLLVRVRRFSRASAEFRGGVDRGVQALPGLRRR